MPKSRASEPVEVLLVPGRLGGTVARVVADADGNAWSETWAGVDGWVRPGPNIDSVMRSPPASEETLRELGVPPSDLPIFET